MTWALIMVITTGSAVHEYMIDRHRTPAECRAAMVNAYPGTLYSAPKARVAQASFYCERISTERR